MLSRVKEFVVNHPVESVILGVFTASCVASGYSTYKESSVERKYKAVDSTPEVETIIQVYKKGMDRVHSLDGKIRQLEEKRLERICLQELEVERKKQKAAKKIIKEEVKQAEKIAEDIKSE